MTGGGQPAIATTFTPQQLDDFGDLLAQHLGRGNVEWVAQSVLGRDVSKEVGNQIGNFAEYCRAVVRIINAADAIGKMAKLLSGEADPNGLLMLGLTTVLQGESLTGAEYQSFKAKYEPFIATAAFEQMFSTVRRTVCAIGLDVEGSRSIIGSGFLIGPDLVMTNYHVVEPLLSISNGAIKATGSGDKLYFFFDYESSPEPVVPPPSALPPNQATQAADDWLVCARPRLVGDGTDNPAPFTNQLDFAVIRLKRPIGNLPARGGGGTPRGWLKLPDSIDVLTRRDLVLFQHPAGKPQKFDIGPFHKLGSPDSRVWYWLNSAPGSSGGAAVDAAGKLFAIHNASVNVAAEATPPGDDRTLNQGIRIDRIVSEIKLSAPSALQIQNATQAALPFWSLTDDIDKPDPVIGRFTFRDYVAEVAAPTGPRVLVVTGPEQSGVRFSAKLLRRAVGSQTRVVVFSPYDIQTKGPKDFIRLLVSELGILDSPPIPDARGTEDIPRWLRGDLPPYLLKVLADAQERTPVRFPAWVVIDTIVPPNQKLLWAENLRECIAVLVGVAEASHAVVDVPQLRWMFLARTPESLPVGSIPKRDDDLAQDSDYNTGFAQCFQFAYQTIDRDTKEIPLGVMKAMAIDEVRRNSANPPRKVLADYVSRLVKIALADRAKP